MNIKGGVPCAGSHAWLSQWLKTGNRKQEIMLMQLYTKVVFIRPLTVIGLRPLDNYCIPTLRDLPNKLGNISTSYIVEMISRGRRIQQSRLEYNKIPLGDKFMFKWRKGKQWCSRIFPSTKAFLKKKHRQGFLYDLSMATWWDATGHWKVSQLSREQSSLQPMQWHSIILRDYWPWKRSALEGMRPLSPSYEYLWCWVQQPSQISQHLLFSGLPL